MTIQLKLSATGFILAGGKVTDQDSHLRLNAGDNIGVLAVPGTITPHAYYSGDRSLYLDYGINGIGWASVFTTHVDLSGYQVGV
ncbi:MAG: hypothetical protein CMN87_14620 [Stappia sp.]|uniref:hypothetical protein n=1 Tax=Stappia sp. TaxID=1870903 RepID=UPI000C4EF494|nr:hypothetical protein [Stappia sp.]MAA99975.1 hypothetical protein [Stappia sp.]MBM21240.1 hypothetical protein [Stappia sp.]